RPRSGPGSRPAGGLNPRRSRARSCSWPRPPPTTCTATYWPLMEGGWLDDSTTDDADRVRLAVGDRETRRGRRGVDRTAPAVPHRQHRGPADLHRAPDPAGAGGTRVGTRG